MYRLIVVDDENTIRQGICNYIDWKSMGFEVIADFEDGEETMEYISRNPVDVILADIEMAQKSGLDIAEYIKRNKLPIRVVIISGYKEFEYARKAIQYGVEHYLLKPLQMQELKTVFENIRKKLDAEQELAREQDNKNSDFEQLLPELREQFFISLLVGVPHSEADIRRKLELLRLDVEWMAPYAVIDVSIGSDLQYYQEQMDRKNLITNIFDGDNGDIRYFPVFFSEGRVKVIAASRKKEGLQEFGDKVSAQIAEKGGNINKLLQLTISMKIEKMYETIFEFEKQLYTFQVHITDDAEEMEIDSEDYERLMQKYKLLVDLINRGDFKELDRLLDNIFFECRNLPLNQLKQLLNNMFSLLSGKYMKMGNDEWKSVNRKLIGWGLFDVESREVLMVKCRELLHEAIGKITEKTTDTSREVVTQAVAYMQQHYGEAISLEMLADKYFLNQSYFSRIFKQYTGDTFTDKLIEIRMEEAKKQLQEGKWKVYEISQKVGYTSEKYFYRVFKQYTGKSPVEYQRSKCLNHEAKKETEKIVQT